jgi:hypothetical protein
MRNKLTLNAVRAELATMGMTIRHNDDEYRVAFRVVNNTPDALLDAEASSYYTGDLTDALNTAHAMRKEKDAHR